MTSTRHTTKRGLRRLAATAAISALAATGMLTAPAANADVSFVADPASYVDTFSGTGSGGPVVGSINNFPGPAAPFGMMQFSPSNGNNGTGYRNGNTNLQGFAVNFASQGCTAFGNFPVLPTTVDPTTVDPEGSPSPREPWNKTSTILTETEHGEIGYLSMDTRDRLGRTIGAQLTATDRSGMAEFTFPAGTTPTVMIRPGRMNNKTAKKSSFNVNPNNGTISGWALNRGFCSATQDNQYKVYFTAKFEQPFTHYGAWNEGTSNITNKTVGVDTTDAEVANVGQAGGYVRFAPGTTTVRMKISMSFVKTGDLELGQADPNSNHYGGSSLNLATEIPTPDYKTNDAVAYADYATAFDAVRQDTYDRWNEILRKIKVSDTASARDIGTFYHSLYRTMLHPNVFEDVDGAYAGFDHFKYYEAGQSGTDIPATIRNIADTNAEYGIDQDHIYSNFSDWDTYRSWAPLVALLEPKVASDIAQTYVLFADQWGQFPRWSIANQSTGQMSGDNASALIAQVHAFGAEDFATDRALHHMYEVTFGENAGEPTPEIPLRKVTRPGAKDYTERKYAPQTVEHQTDHAVTGASVAQEWAIDDFAVSEFAKRIGTENYPDNVPDDVVELFQERTNYWQNHINPLTMCLSARDYAGRYPVGSDCNDTPGGHGYRGTVTGYGQIGFDEATSEQYLWLAPQNMAGLAAILGGRDVTAERLDDFMTGGYNVGANVPKMWAGNEPNFATPWAYNYLGRPWRTQEVVEDIRTQLFGVGRDGAEPGNDDLGAMSSWYVWAALGLYPATPGVDILTVNSPNFEKVQFELGNGNTLTINAPDATTKRYIAGLSVNGVPQTNTAIPDGWQDQDTTLDFTMASSPTMWGTAPADAPPSFDHGSNQVVAYGDPITVKPGDSGTLDYAIQRAAATSDTYRLDFTGAPAGFVIKTTKPQRFDSTGRHVQPLSITVSSNVADGDYTFPITTVTGNGDRSTSDVTVRVAKANGFIAATNLHARSLSAAHAGHFDGYHSVQSDSMAELGLVPGELVDLADVSDNAQAQSTLAGLSVRLPVISEGMDDSVVPNGQTIELTGQPRKLSFIGAAKDANTTGSATVTLDDGTIITNAAGLNLGDWVLPESGSGTAWQARRDTGLLNPMSGNVRVIWTPQRNVHGSSGNPGAYVFATTPYTAPAGRHIVSVTLPGSANDNRRIYAIAQDNHEDEPALPTQNAPTTLTAGTTANVTGTGFVAGEVVEVVLGDRVIGSGTANVSGSVSINVTVPRLTAAGEYGLQLVGATSSTQASTVTVTAATWNPTLSAPNSVLVGSQVVFTAQGFGESEQVAASLGSEQVTLIASASGGVIGSIAAPATPGTVTLTLTGVQSGAAVSKSITVTEIPDEEDTEAPVQLSASPALISYGQSVTLRGQVATGLTGQVEFFDAGRSLGRASIVGNTATLTVTGFDAGTHRITATRVGSGITSATVHVSVAKVALKKITVNGKKYQRGKATKVTVKIGALTNGQRTTGAITVRVGKKTIRTVNVTATTKKISVKIAKKHTKKKKIKVRATFTPTNPANVIGKTSPVKTIQTKKK
ncbi:alpha-1,2-mannosidase, putative [Micrococcales bacterium KH10]|nr:alpha-1,2-mannosidase, putative [Micrococcales bacterium KH10]